MSKPPRSNESGAGAEARTAGATVRARTPLVELLQRVRAEYERFAAAVSEVIELMVSEATTAVASGDLAIQRQRAG